MSSNEKHVSTQLPISTVILAGGLGTRIGGDKGLQRLHGRTLIDCVLEIVGKQSDEVLINVNGAHDAYIHFGHHIISDQIPGWAGPLAGLQSAMHCARHDWVACVPCDTPYLPNDLLARLFSAAKSESTDAATAVAEGMRQPTIALYHKRVLPSLDAYLTSGGRKVTDWQNTLRLSEVVFDNACAFTNINSREDLTEASQMTADNHAGMACTAGAPKAAKGKR